MNTNSDVRRPWIWLWLPILACQFFPSIVRAAEQPAMAFLVSSQSAPEFPASKADLIRQPVVELYAALEMLMRTGQELSFRQRYERVAPVIDRVFDLDYVLRASVGRGWPAISEVSRDRLIAAFRGFTVATYVANFDKDVGRRFEMLAELREVGGDPIVQTRIVAPNEAPICLDYVMYRTDIGWRIVDILLNGTISRVAVQRSDFRALLRQDEADSLIGSLLHKTAELSGGSLAP
jgi:phospholipid transport system substrate-binding protein